MVFSRYSGFHHNITEILLQVALNTKNQTNWKWTIGLFRKRYIFKEMFYWVCTEIFPWYYAKYFLKWYLLKIFYKKTTTEMHKKSCLILYYLKLEHNWFGFWCLMPLATIFQLYCGGNRSTWRKPWVTYKAYYIMLYQVNTISRNI
jgi:hypothetical protein